MSRVNSVSSSLFAKLDEIRQGLMAGLPFPVNWIVATPYMAIQAAVVVPCAVATGAVAGLGDIIGTGVQALRNTPTPEWKRNIADIAENAPDRREVSMYDMSSRDLRDGVEDFEKALKSNTTAQKMRFDGCSFDEASSQAIANALRGNTTLEDLEFSNGGRYGNVEMAPIAEALQANNTLSRLEIHDNGWGGLARKDDARVLAAALKKNTTLTELALTKGRLNSEDAKALAEALRHNKTLTRLNLSYNEIGAEGGQALLDALRENTSLVWLRLDGNDIPKEIRKEIVAQLKFNQILHQAGIDRIKSIDVRDMDLSVTQLKALAKLRREHPEIKIALSEVDKKEVSALVAARRQKKAQPVAPIKPKAQLKKVPAHFMPVPTKKKVKTPQVAKRKSAGNGRGLDDALIKRQRIKGKQKKIIRDKWNEPARW